jgi:glycosyltransferase involved in cell wall biosynthesis
MRIYSFVEYYPSDHKGYLDTQFAHFVRDGHDLRIVAYGRFRRHYSPEVTRFGLDRLTTYVPATLRDLPWFVPAAARVAATRPGPTLRRARRMQGAGLTPRRGAVATVQSALLPHPPPDLCLLHGIIIGRPFWWLRRVYPHTRLVLYFHGYEMPGLVERPIGELQRLLASVDLVVTNTPSSARQVEDIGSGIAPVRVLPMGLDLDMFPFEAERPSSGGTLRLFVSGRLSPEKGHQVLLHALQRAVRDGRDVTCRISGDGPERDALLHLVRKLGLGHRVTLLGYLPREELIREYSTADVFVLPSVPVRRFTENQALVVQEAMATGLPVIASKTGGVPESLAPELQRFLFVPGDANQLAERLAEFARLDAAERRALAQAGRRFVEERYDVRSLNRQLLKLAMEPLPK